MKKVFFCTFLTVACTRTTTAQSVAINTDASLPNASAILDIKSANKGLLIPRMTTAQRTAIATPAKGLIVFDITTNGLWFHNGTVWIALSSGSSTNYWAATGSDIYNNNAGNIGIGTNAPLAPLHIKKDNEALRIEGTSSFISFYNNAGTVPKVFLQNTGDNFYLGTSTGNSSGITQFYSNNSPIMTLAASGNVGIGTTAPLSKLEVKTLNNSYGIIHTGEGGNILGTRMGGTSAGIGTFSNTNMRIFANGNSAVFINSGNSYLGLGVDFPTNKLQVGSVGSVNISDYDFAIGDGANAMGIKQGALMLINTSTDLSILTRGVSGTGNVGLNVLFPTNKLQIGSVGNTGFATNDLAIGNGTNAMAIYQTNASTLIGSTTDIIFRPRNNGQGRVGINTNTPRAPLDVASSASVTSITGFQYSYLNGVSGINGGLVGASSDNPVPNVAIIADGRIYAYEYDAWSDARIKNIIGISNTSKDLETINTIQITDYSMKDKVRYGNQQFKKVIAQEVEKVYPQVVSKHTDYIPNVYQLCNKITKTANGYLLSFNAGHNISKAAKKLQVLADDNGMMAFDIVSIPSANEVIINATDIKGDKAFVYGEEVADFRTVDYEALTTLNISATQELSKLITVQNKKIEALELEIKMLKEKPVTEMQTVTKSK